jgi:hypothetical protein
MVCFRCAHAVEEELKKTWSSSDSSAGPLKYICMVEKDCRGRRNHAGDDDDDRRGAVVTTLTLDDGAQGASPSRPIGL